MRHLRRLLLLTASSVALFAAQPALAGTREYWVAAVPQAHWNIVPNGQDAVTGTQFDPAKTILDTVVYRRFTPHWRRMLPAAYGGIPGPTFHARVGDVILVHFLNLDLDMPHSMQFHGVHYAFPSDGSNIPGFSGPGANVKPGKSFTYRLVAGADSVGVWPYHDHRWLEHGTPVDVRTIGPAESFRIRWREDRPGRGTTTATSSRTWRTG
jgi:manganese oxidase